MRQITMVRRFLRRRFTMTKFNATALAGLMTGGLLMAATPAMAQEPNRGTQPGRTQQRPAAQQEQAAQQGAQRRYNLSRAEQNAINPLLAANTAANDAPAAGQTADWAAVQALLPAAKSAARSVDARYLVSRVELSIALGTNNLAGQEAAIAALLANESTPAPEAANYRNAQSSILNRRAEEAFQANDFATAERLFQQLLQANPNDTRLQGNLRATQIRMGNTGGALQGINEQIRAAEANGGRASEDLYQRAWQIPHNAGQRAEAIAGLQRLLAAYPTTANWRAAVDVVRARDNDVQYLIDVYRLGRIANVVQAEEYVPLANTLVQASYFGEAKALLDAGIAAQTIRADQPDVSRAMTQIRDRLAQDQAGLATEITEARGSGSARQARNVGDALYGYGRYAEAADLYRVALTKGGEDANLLNVRIGASLAMAGQRAEAETALRAVTGNRGEIAALWLAWLNRRQG